MEIDKLTIDEKIALTQMEVTNAFNKYKLPASVIMLICDSIKMMASVQIQHSRGDDNVNKQTNDSDNSES